LINLIDSHAHLDLPEFDPDRQDVISRAAAAGISRIITVGIDIATSRNAIALAEQHRGIYATVGIHPGSTSEANPDDFETLKKLAGHPKVVAIGETGLDFYRMYSPKESQVEWLLRQLNLAYEVRLPVILHSRQAEPDLYDIVSNFVKTHPKEDKPRGVVHCFGGNAATAAGYVELGFCISFGSYIGYPSAKTIGEVIRSIPGDRLLLETDCPFLPPPDRRGQRNEPAYMVQTAQTMADSREVSTEEIGRLTSENTERLFQLG
jgi:TatD DNase family protein